MNLLVSAINLSISFPFLTLVFVALFSALLLVTYVGESLLFFLSPLGFVTLLVVVFTNALLLEFKLILQLAEATPLVLLPLLFFVPLEAPAPPVHFATPTIGRAFFLLY